MIMVTYICRYHAYITGQAQSGTIPSSYRQFIVQCFADAVDDGLVCRLTAQHTQQREEVGRVFRLTAQHTQQREVGKECIQGSEPGANTLDLSNRSVVGGLSKGETPQLETLDPLQLDGQPVVKT